MAAFRRVLFLGIAFVTFTNPLLFADDDDDGKTKEKVDRLVISPETFQFPETIAGQSVSQSFTLTNNRGQSVKIAPLTQPALSLPFSLSGGTCGETLAKKSSCTLVVTFSPVAAGEFEETLAMTSEKGNHKDHKHKDRNWHLHNPCKHGESIALLELRGTGLVPMAQLSIVGEAAYDFQQRTVGSETIAIKPFTISNQSDSAANGFAPVGDTGPYSVSGGTCGNQIPGGGTCTIEIKFTPTEVGVHERTVSFNASNNVEPIRFQLKSEGIPVLDPTAPNTFFGTDGSVSLDSSIGTFTGTQLSADSKLVSGGSVLSTSYDFFAVQLNLNGTLDTSFNSTGMQLFDLNNNSNDIVRSVLLIPGGGLILAGYSGSACAAAKLGSNGALDPSFHGTGIHIMAWGSIAFCYSAVLDSQSRAILVGTTRVGSFNQAVTVRLQTNGEFDTSFNLTGRLFHKVGRGHSMNFAAAVQPDGKILTAGYGLGLSSFDHSVVRYLENGTLDSTFGTGGISFIDYGGNEKATSLLLDESTGQIFFSGRMIDVNGGFGFTLSRLNPNGLLDNTFGTNGLVFGSPEPAQFSNSAVVRAPTGEIFVAWVNYSEANPSQNKVKVSKFSSNGLPDTSFGSQGTLVLDAVYGKGDQAPGIVLHDRRLSISGASSNGNGIVSEIFY